MSLHNSKGIFQLSGEKLSPRTVLQMKLHRTVLQMKLQADESFFFFSLLKIASDVVVSLLYSPN